MNTSIRPILNFCDLHADLEPDGDTGERSIDIFESVTPELARRVIHQLLSYGSDGTGLPIHMFIFSPGGCVVSGLAIIDTMRHVAAPVYTYAIGHAASMGAILLAAGAEGHRHILPHSHVMIHQASGGASGTLENARANLAYQTRLEDEADAMLAQFTGRSFEEVRSASRIDNWMAAPDAKAFGLVDAILTPHTPNE